MVGRFHAGDDQHFCFFMHAHAHTHLTRKTAAAPAALILCLPCLYAIPQIIARRLQIEYRLDGRGDDGDASDGGKRRRRQQGETVEENRGRSTAQVSRWSAALHEFFSQAREG